LKYVSVVSECSDSNQNIAPTIVVAEPRYNNQTDQ